MVRYLKSGIILIIIVNLLIGSAYIAYPMPYKEIVLDTSKRYEVDPLLIYSVMKAESKFDPNALSRKGAKGLMQIMDNTGAWVAELAGIEDYSPDKLFDPSLSIEMGGWYIGRLLRQYEGDLNTVLAAYNAGAGNVAKWRKNKAYSEDGKIIHTIPFKETRGYIKKVNLHYKIYEWLYKD